MLKEYEGKYVTIMSCSNCNVKCKHCYISYKGNFDSEELYNMVKILKEKYEIMINGSEPLLHKDFLKSYKECEYKTPITNGLVFKDNYDYIDKLKENGIDELRISYHFDMHKIISQVDEEYLKELFKVIKEKGMKLTLMCSLSALNYKNIEEYCLKAIELKADSIKFTNFLSQGRAKELDDNLILNDAQIREFFSLLKDVRDKYDKNILNIKRCGSFGPDLNNKSNFKCESGINNLCITPDGNVYPCVFLTKKGYEIGVYKDNKVYIDDKFECNQKRCLALDLLNRKGE